MDKIILIKNKINNLNTKNLNLIDNNLNNILNEIKEIEYIDNLNQNEMNEKILLEMETYREEKEFINKYLSVIMYMHYLM